LAERVVLLRELLMLGVDALAMFNEQLVSVCKLCILCGCFPFAYAAGAVVDGAVQRASLLLPGSHNVLCCWGRLMLEVDALAMFNGQLVRVCKPWYRN
jgi:hypothetical protein